MSLWLDLNNSLKWFVVHAEQACFLLLILLLPTQFGKHFVYPSSSVAGIQIDYLFPVVYTTDILLCLLFLFRFFAFIKKPRRQHLFSLKTPVGLLLCGWFVVLLVSTLFAKQQLLSWYGLSKWVELAFFATYTAWVLSAKKVNIWPFLLIPAVFESLLALLQTLHQGAFQNILYFLGERAIYPSTPGAANVALNGQLFLRPYGTFSHPNVLAGYLVVIFSLLLFNLSFFPKQKRNYLVIVLALIFFALFTTLSRSAIVVVVAQVLYYFLFVAKKKKKTLFLGIVLLGFLFVTTALSTRFLNTSFTEEASTDRIELAQVAFSMFLNHSVLGVGLNNFIVQIPTFYHGTLSHEVLQPVHNIFLLILAEQGALGFFFFLSLLFVTFKQLFKKASTMFPVFSKHSLLSALFSILLLGLIDHYFLTLQQTQLLFAFIIGSSFAKRTFSRTKR